MSRNRSKFTNGNPYHKQEILRTFASFTADNGEKFSAVEAKDAGGSKFGIISTGFDKQEVFTVKRDKDALMSDFRALKAIKKTPGIKRFLDSMRLPEEDREME